MIVDLTFRLPCALKVEKNLKSLAYDGIVAIVTSDLEASNNDELLKEHFASSAKVNSVGVGSSPSVVDHLIQFFCIIC
jgi:hypothetical protein